MILTYGELQEIHRWIPVSEKLPKKITKAQRKKSYYPPLLIVDMKMGNSVEVGYFNEKGYFSTMDGWSYNKDGEDSITHWKKIYLPNRKHRRGKNVIMQDRFEILDL